MKPIGRKEFYELFGCRSLPRAANAGSSVRSVVAAETASLPRCSFSEGGSFHLTSFLETVRVTVFKGKVPVLLISGALPLEILLSHHV